MKPQELKNLGDVLGQDLSGWQITYAYYLVYYFESKNLMGVLPVVTSEGEEIITVLDKKLLHKVWDHIKHRSAKIHTTFTIAHLESGVAFCLELEGQYPEQIRPLHIFSGEVLDNLCQKDSPFKWFLSAGLIDKSDDESNKSIKEPDFDS